MGFDTVSPGLHKNNTQLIHEVRHEMIYIIIEIKPQTCQIVIENLNKRMDVYRGARGGLLEIFFVHNVMTDISKTIKSFLNSM